MSDIIEVQRNLTTIIAMCVELRAQAINDAQATEDGHSLPGGKAMIALAPVANQEAWTNRYEAAEHWGRDASYIEAEDDAWEPPLQTLCFWSEQWRTERGVVLDVRPTIESEANFIKFNLEWVFDNELHWADFAKDIAKALARIENMLHAGERPERGVPCMYDGARLERSLECKRTKGVEVWDWSDWSCPKCHRTWTDSAYWANVNAANEAAQREEIEGEAWVSVDYAARELKRSAKTIRTWLDRREVASICIIVGRRTKFVNLDEARVKNDEAKRRRSKLQPCSIPLESTRSVCHARVPGSTDAA